MIEAAKEAVKAKGKDGRPDESDDDDVVALQQLSNATGGWRMRLRCSSGRGVGYIELETQGRVAAGG